MIVEIAGFDPIPIDYLYHAINMWNFQWTNVSPTRGAFERIGIEDRIFLNILGSMVIAMVAFLGSQSLCALLFYFNPKTSG